MISPHYHIRTQLTLVDTRLNEKQRSMLAHIRQHEPLATDQVDGRTAKALLGRGLIELDWHRVRTTKQGQELLDSPPQKRRTRRPRNPARAARASAILSAINRLDISIPSGAEVEVGPILAAADDVLQGLRQYAANLR
jgi:hypothetical protein